MRITKEQYTEYQELKKWARKNKIRESAKSISTLYDDIDDPIRNCVGMLALLGCEPTYSCCGFDYDGQPFHKAHQYGEPYIKLSVNNTTLGLVKTLCDVGTIWQARSARGAIDLFNKIPGANPHWRAEECIHFSEECLTAILWLEKFLWGANEYMFDSIVLLDTNARVGKKVKHWQYPAKSPWTVKKSNIAESMKPD